MFERPKRVVRSQIKKFDIVIEELSSLKKEFHAERKNTNSLRKSVETVLKNSETLRNVEMLPLYEEMRREYTPRQLGFLETVEKLADEELSFVRVGDGELKMALDLTINHEFQKNTVHLQRDLIGAIEESRDREGVLFGSPHFYRGPHWSAVWSRIWPEFKELIEPARVMGNAHVTRPIYFDVTEQEGVEAWRRVWDKKNVTIITGKSSRFELTPELFDNLASAERIDSVDKHAYKDIPRLLTLVDAAKETDLFLVALGPAGTILTAEIAKRGRRAVDVGHISSSYATSFKGAKRPEQTEFSRLAK